MTPGSLDSTSPPFGYPPIEKAAVISEDGVYRYTLERVWDESRGLCMFVMLNPSTADAAVDDPTIRRCVDFARRWGYGGLLVGNLYGYRATDPKALRTVADPVGPDNDHHIAAMAERANVAVVAWGAHPGVQDRVATVMGGPLVHRRPFALKVTQSGAPSHPLYIRKDVEPNWWSPNA